MATFVVVEEDEFSGTGDSVVTCDDSDKFAGTSRYRASVEHGVRPVGITAIVFFLVGAVRVHVHEDSAEVVRGVGVFPA